jgi:hypothetical protein
MNSALIQPAPTIASGILAQLFDNRRQKMKVRHLTSPRLGALLAVGLSAGALVSPAQAQAQQKRPNVIVIMSDDVGWGDLGAYGGGETRGAPTPNLDQIATEGVRFTTWYGQASCTAGRASFITGRLPIRSAIVSGGVRGERSGQY